MNIQALSLWFAYEAMNELAASSTPSSVELWEAGMRAVTNRMGDHAVVDVRTLQSWHAQLPAAR